MHVGRIRIRFFFPGATDPKNAEEIYALFRKFAVDTTGNAVHARRIFRLTYRHDAQLFAAVVGVADSRFGEVVVAILEGELAFLAYMPTRGVNEGDPMMIGKKAVTFSEDFDAG